MKEFQDKRKLKKKLYSYPVGLFLLMCIGFLTVAVIDLSSKKKRVKELLDSAIYEKNILTEKKLLVEDHIQSLNTVDGQERLIREKYSVALPGEGVVVVIDENKTEEVYAKTKKSWYIELFDSMMSVFK